MKFKTIFIIFNAVIIFSFLFIFFMPMLLLGVEYFPLFASKNWIAALIFFLTLVVINTYFIRNWKLFSLLENEDWHLLIRYLEEQIYDRSIVRPHQVKMLINAYLITSNTQKITNLEALVKEKRPSILKKFALQLGIPYLLNNNPEESEKYFGRLLADKGLHDRDWIRWNYAFSLMQQKQFPAAREELLGLLEAAGDPLVRLLTLFMLDSFTQVDQEVSRKVEEGRLRLSKDFNRERLKKRIEQGGKNMEVIMLGQILREASDWLYGSKRQKENLQ